MTRTTGHGIVINDSGDPNSLVSSGIPTGDSVEAALALVDGRTTIAAGVADAAADRSESAAARAEAVGDAVTPENIEAFNNAAQTIQDAMDMVDAPPDSVTAASISDGSSATRAALDSFYVPNSSLVPVALSLPGYQQDVLVAPAGTGAIITLGGDPLPGSLAVAAAGLVLAPNVYSLTGRKLSLAGAAAGSTILVTYTYDKSAGTPAVATVSAVISDSFNRADSTTGLGTTPGGKTWAPLTGMMGILSNQAYQVVGTAANDGAVIDTGWSDVSVQVKLAAFNGSPGLAIRTSDVDNGLITNGIGLYQRTAGVNSYLGGFSTAFASGDTIRVVASGTSLKVYRQAASTGAFLPVLTATSSFNQTVTKHGIRVSSDGSHSSRWDDFLVTQA